MKKPEIMSPIRDWASLEACKDYADAVYFGLPDLSMRAKSDFLTLKNLSNFINKCHEYNLKTYLTLNSTVYNQEIIKAKKIIKKAKEDKIDAIIVWDPVLIQLAKKENVTFFISTQANISNYESALFYEKLGAKRLVLARELNLKQIKEIRKKVKIEIEVFVHGAMCLSVSGRCILSAHFYGKSANRGYCAQPCREKWFLSNKEGKIINQGKYFLSAKDLSMIEYIPELIKAGIDSFKIEGRRRDPRYIHITSKCYKEAREAYFNKKFTQEKVKKWKEELESIYHRGYSTGFYFSSPGKEGISYDHEGNISKVKKILLGKVIHYYSKLNVAEIKLNHHGIKIGDRVVLEGATTYLEQIVDALEINKKEIKKATKGSLIALKVKEKVRENDHVFLLKEK